MRVECGSRPAAQEAEGRGNGEVDYQSTFSRLVFVEYVEFRRQFVVGSDRLSSALTSNLDLLTHSEGPGAGNPVLTDSVEKKDRLRGVRVNPPSSSSSFKLSSRGSIPRGEAQPSCVVHTSPRQRRELLRCHSTPPPNRKLPVSPLSSSHPAYQ